MTISENQDNSDSKEIAPVEHLSFPEFVEAEKAVYDTLMARKVEARRSQAYYDMIEETGTGLWVNEDIDISRLMTAPQWADTLNRVRIALNKILETTPIIHIRETLLTIGPVIATLDMPTNQFTDPAKLEFLIYIALWTTDTHQTFSSSLRLKQMNESDDEQLEGILTRMVGRFIKILAPNISADSEETMSNIDNK